MSVRIWSTSKDNRFRYETLSAKYLTGALLVMRKSFFVNETISRVVNMAECEESSSRFEDMLSEIAEDGASIIAIDISTDTVVGVAFNKLLAKDDPDTLSLLQKYINSVTAAALSGLLHFVSEMEKLVDIFKHYGVSNAMDHMFLATHPAYYKQGIGIGLVTATVELAKALFKGEDVTVPISEDKYPWKNKTPPKIEAVIALFTSPISQKIGRNLGWDEILITYYDKLFYQGKPYSSRLEKDNKTNAYMAIKFKDN